MKIKRWWISIVLYFIVVSIVITGFSLSRFSTTLANTGAENTSAPPDVSFSTWVLKHEAAEISLDNMKPGDVRVIPVTIKNFDSVENKVSDYNQSVYLRLSTTGNLPLVFTLTGEANLAIAPATTNEYKSSVLSFTANQQETKSLSLSVTWPADKTDYSYIHEIDYLVLSLEAMQGAGPSFAAASYTMSDIGTAEFTTPDSEPMPASLPSEENIFSASSYSESTEITATDNNSIQPESEIQAYSDPDPGPAPNPQPSVPADPEPAGSRPESAT